MLPWGPKWVQRDFSIAVAGIGFVAMAIVCGTVIFDSASAQDADRPEPSAQDAGEAPAARPVKKRPPKVVAPKKAEPAPIVAPMPAQPVPAGPNVAGRLKDAGAGTCAAQLNAAAAGVMGNVASFNTVSNWPKTAIDKRMASVSIGQKYPDGSAVPYAATTIVATPNPVGPCDAVTVQVLPSPLSCDKVRDNMAAANKVMGNLAGVLVMQDGNGAQTMLVPTAANACVLVGVRTAFGK